jgi:hypothetical protein
MTGFSFSLEQIKSAPLEVRRWVEREIAASLAQIAGPGHEASPAHATTLAACMPDEAAQLFELFKADFLLSQVFFELGREALGTHGAAPLRAVDIGDLLRHTRLASAERLSEYFSTINRAFQAIRNDPEAMLFGFDQQGHVYVHEATCRSIRHSWEQLYAPATAVGADGPMSAGFAAPHLGPSEAVATHMPAGGSYPG